MGQHSTPVSFRGASRLGIKNDATVKAMLDEFAKTWEDFKVSNDERLKGVESGFDDVVKREEVDKVNAALEDIQSKINEAVERQAALEANGGASGTDMTKVIDKFTLDVMSANGRTKTDDVSPICTVEEYNDYRKTLNMYLRRGDDKMDIKNAMSVGSDPAGGYTVTPDMSGRIIEKVYETSPMRQVCNVVTIGTDVLEGFNDLEEASSGWVGETATRTETNTPNLGKWEIPVHEQYALPKITQKLLDDAGFDVAAWLATKVGDKFGRTENTAFLTGTSNLQPTGLLTYPTAATADATRPWGTFEYVASGSTSAIADTDHLITLVFALKAAYRGNANWGMSRATVAEIRKLKDGQGNYLWQPNFGERQGGQLLGYGIVEMEDMPAIAANAHSIGFGDWREAYTIVDRTGFRTLRDPYTQKGYVLFYTTKRVGGGAQNFEAMKFMKFAAS